WLEFMSSMPSCPLSWMRSVTAVTPAKTSKNAGRGAGSAYCGIFDTAILCFFIFAQYSSRKARKSAMSACHDVMFSS
ncbi:MAG: hypothetical protein ACI8TQ_003682, partial [Planctomycetota bacterium]